MAMTDEEFETAMIGFMEQYTAQTEHSGAIYILNAQQVADAGSNILIITDEAFIDEFRTRMDGNQTPREGTVVAVIG